MATRKKHTPEQVVRKLATADRMLNESKDVADVCRELQVCRADALPVAQPVRRDERQRRQTAQGPGAGERHAQAAAGRRGAGEGRTQGDIPGKLLSPERRRAAVHHLMRTMKVSERFACRVTGQNRSTQRRPPATTTPADRTPDYAPGCGRGPRIIPGVGFVLPITTPAPRVGTSTTRRSSGCGATRACACRNGADASAWAPPRHRTRRPQTHRTWCGR